MRLLIILGLIYLFYRALKRWMLSLNAPKSPADDRRPPQVDDVMVKDPFCQVYFPKRDGIRVVRQGEELFFCSKRCRDKFIEADTEERK